MKFLVSILPGLLLLLAVSTRINGQIGTTTTTDQPSQTTTGARGQTVQSSETTTGHPGHTLVTTMGQSGETSVTAGAAVNQTSSTSDVSSSTSTTATTTTGGSTMTAEGSAGNSAAPTTTVAAGSSSTIRTSAADAMTTTLSPLPTLATGEQQQKEDPAPALYKLCGAKTGTVCYGDKGNCIKNSDCTFLGAITENDTIIDIKVLTRVYDPPYDGVNLTVQLLRNKQGNESVIRCTKPRFKSFKIRLSWKNKTSFEVPDQPGNETQLAQTIINKEDLQRECEQDQAGTATPPSQALALQFYIANNNTLVHTGLTHVDVQDPAATAGKDAGSSSDRQGRKLDADPPKPSKEDVLYEMCLKNTAKCFGDRTGCTEGHNCTILGVIRETPSNYHVYLVTKSYNPPVSNINLTLTLNTTLNNATNLYENMSLNSTSNSTAAPNATTDEKDTEECEHAEFKDLSIQSLWMAREIPQATNGSEILETTVDKATVQSRCQVNVRALKTNLSDIEGISGDVLNFYLKFHLENGTLVPLDVSNDSDDELSSQHNTFQVGHNGTAHLANVNTGTVIPAPDDESSLAGRSMGNVAGNGSNRALASYYALTLILPCFLAFTLNLFK